MGSFRRDGRLRKETLWVVFVVALLAGALLGWAYRSWTNPSLEQRARRAAEEMKSAVEKLTR